MEFLFLLHKTQCQPSTVQTTSEYNTCTAQQRLLSLLKKHQWDKLRQLKKTPHTLETYGKRPDTAEETRQKTCADEKQTRKGSVQTHSSVICVNRLNRECCEGFTGATNTTSSKVLLHDQISVTTQRLCSFEPFCQRMVPNHRCG